MQIDKLALVLAQIHGDVPLDIRRRVRTALSELPERQRAVVNARFAPDGGKPTTLEEFARGQQSDITTERARLLEHHALHALSRAVFPAAD